MLDDIGIEPMTFRMSKESPPDVMFRRGVYMDYFGKLSVNRVGTLDIMMS